MEQSCRDVLEGGERLGRAESAMELLLRLARLMKKAFGCRMALCYQLHGAGRALLPVGWSGLSPRSIRIFLQHPLTLAELPLLEETLRRRRRFSCSGELCPGIFPAQVAELFPAGSLLVLPLQVRGEVIGVAFALREIPFSYDESSLLGWTVSHAALALGSLAPARGGGAGPAEAGGQEGEPDRAGGAAALHAPVPAGTHSTLVATVSSLINAIEAKSRWTKGHSERVMRSCVIIAAALGLGPKELERVRLGGLLHDIGKIGVEGVLESPGLLHAGEGPAMKLHPEMGVAILEPIAELKEVLPGILHHHEKMDGSGYPAGLKGDQIPLDARIIAVADAFDAIVSERPYKSGSARAAALSELELCAGSQFDPRIVRCLRDFITGVAE